MSPLVGTTYMRKVQGDNSASPTFKIGQLTPHPSATAKRRKSPSLERPGRRWREPVGAALTSGRPTPRRDKKPAPWGHGVSPYIICGGRR